MVRLEYQIRQSRASKHEKIESGFSGKRLDNDPLQGSQADSKACQIITKLGQDESESAPMCSNSTNQATENNICLKAHTEANQEKMNASSCLDSPQTPASDDEIDCMSQGQLESRL